MKTRGCRRESIRGGSVRKALIPAASYRSKRRDSWTASFSSVYGA